LTFIISRRLELERCGSRAQDSDLLRMWMNYRNYFDLGEPFKSHILWLERRHFLLGLSNSLMHLDGPGPAHSAGVLLR
jgi:hypothetical protein